MKKSDFCKLRKMVSQKRCTFAMLNHRYTEFVELKNKGGTLCQQTRMP